MRNKLGVNDSSAINCNGVIIHPYNATVLDDPDGIDSWVLMRNLLRGICNDIVHCTDPSLQYFFLNSF